MRAADLPLAERIDLVSGADTWRTTALPGRGVPAVTMSDGPHGLRFQDEHTDRLGLAGSAASTCFPTASCLASTWDDDLVAEVGSAIAVEARALGVALVLGPGLNLKRHPLCGRAFEYFSEDPLLSGRLAAALVTGIQREGVGACLKHFAVNNQESHRFVVDAVVDERTLRELYLTGFEHAVRTARPWAVMSSYNLVNGEYAGASRQLLTEVLRGEWGFDGLVVSDWGAVHDRVASLAAGLDLEMPSSGGLFDREVATAVRRGRLPEATVTTSAQRVLDLVARAPRPGGAGDTHPVPHDDHDALARRAAAAGTVLLQNDGLLPLEPDATLAVVGAFAEHPRFQGAGSSQVTPTRVTTALAALRERGADVTYAAGYDPDTGATSPALLAEAVAAAEGADVVVVLVGLPAAAESEGFDRDHLDLPAGHDALVEAVAAAHPRVVVALSNGAPVLLPWRGTVGAVIESYLGGQASGGALVDVLYGDAEPAGRLAESFPAAQADVAADPWFPGEPRQVEHREALLVGYRHHTSGGPPAMFPFGHGLSYTTFAWSGFDVDRDGVELTVTNTGGRSGSEVVQVYVADHTGVALRPARELAAYAAVRLAPGASRRVRLALPARAFAFWDVRTHAWAIPAGRFDVEVARSSTDVVHRTTLDVAGDVTDSIDPPTGTDFARRLGHPVPTPVPTRPFTRQTTMEELRTSPAGRALVALLWRAAPLDDATRADPLAMRMVERSFDELPLRGAAIFAGGRLPLPVLDAVVRMVGLRPWAAGRDRLRRRRGGD